MTGDIVVVLIILGGMIFVMLSAITIIMNYTKNIQEEDPYDLDEPEPRQCPCDDFPGHHIRVGGRCTGCDCHN